MFSSAIAHLLVNSTPARSKYAASKAIDEAPQTFQRWYTGETIMSDTVALKSAAILGFPANAVLLGLFIERSAKAGEPVPAREAMLELLSPEAHDILGDELVNILYELCRELPYAAITKQGMKKIDAMASCTLEKPAIALI